MPGLGVAVDVDGKDCVGDFVGDVWRAHNYDLLEGVVQDLLPCEPSTADWAWVRGHDAEDFDWFLVERAALGDNGDESFEDCAVFEGVADLLAVFGVIVFAVCGAQKLDGLPRPD